MKFLTVILYMLYALLNVSGAALIKTELLHYKLVGLQDYFFFLFRLKVMLGFFIILISSLILFKALSIERFSSVIPMATGINFFITVMIGVFIFQDKISLIQSLGLILILTGIVLVSISAKAV